MTHFCKSPKPHHRSTKIKRRLACFRFHELETCQCWLVSHTLVVLVATLTALNLRTDRLRVLWFELPVARNLIVNAKRYVTLIAFLNLVFFLLTARPTRHTRLLKSLLWNLKKKSWIFITVVHPIQHYHSASRPIVHRCDIKSMLASPKNASCLSLIFVMQGT
jgi:hypothetical protein